MRCPSGDGILRMTGKRAQVVAESAGCAVIPPIGGQDGVIAVPDQGGPRRDEPIHHVDVLTKV
jgi:hypothetical protein